MRTHFKTGYHQDIRLFADGRVAFRYAVLVALAAALPFALDDFLLGEVTNVLIWAIAGMGLMVLTGHAGQPSLGHAAFLAVGCYVHAILMDRFGLPFLASFTLAGLATGLVGVLVAIPALRLHGIYLAMPDSPTGEDGPLDPDDRSTALRGRGFGSVQVRKGDEQLCFLPLCHVLERLISVFVPIAAKSTVNFAESVETVFDNLREVSPATFTAVPRVWEKIHSRVQVLAAQASRPGRRACERAIACGLERAGYLMEGRPVPVGLEARFRFWDRLVLANLRRMIGLDGVRTVTTGAAPISPDLVKWYLAIGAAT